MGLETIAFVRNSFPVESLTYRVLTCYLSQPAHIGHSADSLRRLNLKDTSDLKVYGGGVHEDFTALAKQLGEQEKEEAWKILDAGWEMLKIEDTMVVAVLVNGKMEEIRQPEHPRKANFVICCKHGDWSGFRTYAGCRKQYRELENTGRISGYFWVEQR